MIAPPPGRRARVETRSGNAFTGVVRSVKAGVVVMDGCRIPAQRVKGWRPA